MKVSEVHTTEKSGWKPVKGETIAGRIQDIDVTEGAYGAYPVIEVELEDGTVSVHAFHDQLRRKLDSRGAQIGEMVAITSHGRTGNGEGTDAYLYDVRVGDQPRQFDYGALKYTGAPAKQRGPQDSDYGRAPQSESKAKREGGDDEIPF